MLEHKRTVPTARFDFTSCSIRAATPARAESIISAFFSNAVQSVRAAITTFLSARILFLSTRSVLKALPFQHCFSSACPTIAVYLNKSENAPPVKSGALYQNTVPLPHLKHRLILMCQFGVSFFCPESLAAQHLQFSYHCSMLYGFVKESVRSPSKGGKKITLAEANSLVIGVSFGS